MSTEECVKNILSALLLILAFGACAHKDKFKRNNVGDSTLEVEVVGKETKLVLNNSKTPEQHGLSRASETEVAIVKTNGSGILCEAIHILPRSSQSTVVTRAHKDIFLFKKKEILEERRTQTDAPFYTNRFRFTYVFIQRKSNPGLDRQQVRVVCQSDFSSVQPAMDLTIKEINEIFRSKGIEVKNQLSEDDAKDVIY
jgi:hypothetical protein